MASLEASIIQRQALIHLLHLFLITPKNRTGHHLDGFFRRI